MIVASFFDNLTSRNPSFPFPCDFPATKQTTHIKRGKKKCFNGPKINKRSKKKKKKTKCFCENN